ncbi:AmmeMemoRadiSam system protein A [Candidatus Woesearchaeota archaeon]|nr:AmmeMemoRadiSam system protein A [Candidatus Woesearchaeota archaeon]
MNEANHQSLLKLARETIKAKFFDRKYELEFIPREFREKRGTFVTLHKQGELRGCIGYIYPIKSVYEGVKENALNAAFHDPRFKPLQKEELREIEISILSQPIKVDFKEPMELIRKLKPGHRGVILEKKYMQWRSSRRSD